MPVFIFYIVSTALVLSFVMVSITKLPGGLGWYIGQMALAGAAVLTAKIVVGLLGMVLHSPLHMTN